MNRIVAAFALTTAFAAGCGVTHFLRPALAAENMIAQVIHTGDLEGDALSPVNTAGMRNKVLAVADGMTIAIQDGSPPKHLHANAHEIQYILEEVDLGEVFIRDVPRFVVSEDLPPLQTVRTELTAASAS